MRSRFGKWLIVVALVIATGGHWAVLQSVAWLGMFVKFSQAAPVAMALEQTFDGRHPCQLCKAVQAGQASEQKQQMQKLETKQDFWLIQTVSLLYPPAPPSVSHAEPNTPYSRTDSPPTPPPRLA